MMPFDHALEALALGNAGNLDELAGLELGSVDGAADGEAAGVIDAELLERLEIPAGGLKMAGEGLVGCFSLPQPIWTAV